LIPPAENSQKVVTRGGAGPWGHVLVSASACVLTVSILGSAVFLTHRLYSRHLLRQKVREFISSLDNRSPEELADRALQLKLRPKLAAHFLPEIAASLNAARSERQLCAAIQLSEAFLEHKRIRNALLGLRSDARENVAAAAVRALAQLQPPAEAAAVLGRCLEESRSGAVGPAAVDEAIAGLFHLGQPGLDEMKARLPLLSPDRRVWIAGYVNAAGGPYRRGWLELLGADPDKRVQEAGLRALGASEGSETTAQVARKG